MLKLVLILLGIMIFIIYIISKNNLKQLKKTYEKENNIKKGQ